MEPPEAAVSWSPYSPYNYNNLYSNCSAIIISVVDANAKMLMPSLMDVFIVNEIMRMQYRCVRARGGMPGGEAMYTNQDRKFNKIPYLTNLRFMWNGLPCTNFQIKVEAMEDDSSEASTHSTVSHQSLFANSSMPMKPKETFRRRPSFKRQ